MNSDFGKHRDPGPQLTCEMLRRLRGRKVEGDAEPHAAEHDIVGPFLDLWAYDLGHRNVALALTFLCRALTVYEPLVIVAESEQISTSWPSAAPRPFPGSPVSELHLRPRSLRLYASNGFLGPMLFGPQRRVVSSSHSTPRAGMLF